MIVFDTNILTYLFLPTEHTAKAESLLKASPKWAVPTLWRSEFRNVLALYLRKNLLTFEQAVSIQAETEYMVRDSAAAEIPFETSIPQPCQIAQGRM